MGPSLFSRTRSSSSTPRSSTIAPDEFGNKLPGSRIMSSSTGFSALWRDKVKDKEQSKSEKSRRPERSFTSPLIQSSALPNSNTITNAAGSAFTFPPPPPMEGSFLPLTVASPQEKSDGHDYGYLCYERDTILGIEQVKHIVEVVSEELGSRGLTTPRLFSTQALDATSSRVRSLIHSFMSTYAHYSDDPPRHKWHDEVRFSGPHELGMFLRWALARIIRVAGGAEVRGFVDWRSYLVWRDEEEALGYPQSHFPSFLTQLLPPIQSLLSTLFVLFSRLTAHAASSGLTPAALGSLFGPLIFGLGPPNRTFSQSYAAYLRTSHATEHLILSFIRNTEYETARTSPVALPSRLRDWIRGYPNMLPPLVDMEKASRGAKMVRVASVRRNVRLYSPDLVHTAASWAGEGNVLQGRKEWTRVIALGMTPRYTESYRKRLDLPASFHPSLSSTSLSSEPTSPSRVRFPQHETVAGRPPDFPSSASMDSEGSGRFTSLTDMKWGEFEELGFSGVDTSKLQFDLNESARQTRSEKRNTLTWNDFSDTGFSRSDAPLSATLQFDTPISSSINAWPLRSDAIHRKLKKQQKVLPTFGWDTTPVPGQEWVIEEGMIACWADLMLSSGWVDWNEGTFREANWALVEFRALPPTALRENMPSDPTADPRTDAQWFLFEEFVPSEYRDQLVNPPKKRSVGIFTTKNKEWKPAATLNGKPYVGLPRSPSHKATEFDEILNSSVPAPTRQLSLHRERAGFSSSASLVSGPPQTGPRDDNKPLPMTPPRNSHGSRPTSSSTVTPRGAMPKFRIPGTKRPQGFVGSQYDAEIDFETLTASETSSISQDDHAASSNGDHIRRSGRENAWVDILVPDQQQAAVRRDMIANSNGKTWSDPELAREEIQRALGHGQGPSHMPVPASSHYDIYSQDGDYEEEEIMEIPPSSSTPAIHIRAPTADSLMHMLPPPSRKLPPPPPRSNDGDHEDFEPFHEHYADSASHYDDEGQDNQVYLSRGSSPHRSRSASSSPNRSQLHLDEESDVSHYPVPPADQVPEWEGNGASTRFIPGARPPPLNMPLPTVPLPLLEQGASSSPGRYIHGMPLQNVQEEE